jgi:CO/xanthine dehydrogenase FAD-binding subunit
MKPSKFEYFAPTSLQEAVGILEDNEEAKALAGGQSLIPIMNFRLAQPGALVDLNNIPGLDYIREEDGSLVIGGLTRIREVEISELVRAKCPILSEATGFIGHLPNRNRGTVGGSVAHADPSAELPTVLTALDAQIRTFGASGEKTYQPDEFFLSYLTTPLENSDLVTEIRVPLPATLHKGAFMELSRRHGDFAIVAVAVLLEIDENNVCTKARISLGGVSDTPLRVEQAEELLEGETLTEELLKKASAFSAEIADPESDYHATAEYRRNMAQVYTLRTLKKALGMEEEGSK